ncbi:MAG TPA: M56 family metallopeptidase [Solirubrobacteraceae bacterium]|nr:M56 family metallopeptidase [Solirubrobacteraceae bacterium]
MATTRRLDRPAARAHALASAGGLMLGLLGLASFVPVFARLLESWRVSAHAVAHHVSILGQTLSYPAANAGALVVLALALLGGIVAAIALCAISSELTAARRLARRLAQFDPTPRDGIFVIDDERAEAFCAGLLRPRVYVTTGALARLDAPALDAVLVHEREHARRRDPLRLATSRVIARSLFFLPAIRELCRGQMLLAEASADESAVSAAAGDRSAVARAILSFSDREASGSAGVDPARVDYLLGETPGWRFPALMCAAALALLAIVITLAILVGREAAGSATLDPPFLSAQPCIVMLALIPCAAGLIAARAGRVLRRPGRPGRRLAS